MTIITTKIEINPPPLNKISNLILFLKDIRIKCKRHEDSLKHKSFAYREKISLYFEKCLKNVVPTFEKGDDFSRLYF